MFLVPLAAIAVGVGLGGLMAAKAKPAPHVAAKLVQRPAYQRHDGGPHTGKPPPPAPKPPPPRVAPDVNRFGARVDMKRAGRVAGDALADFGEGLTAATKKAARRGKSGSSFGAVVNTAMGVRADLLSEYGGAAGDAVLKAEALGESIGLDKTVKWGAMAGPAGAFAGGIADLGDALDLW